jgi:hypothetical protein
MDPWWGPNDEEFLCILAEDDVEALACLADDNPKKLRFQQTREKPQVDPVSPLPGSCWCVVAVCMWRNGVVGTRSAFASSV